MNDMWNNTCVLISDMGDVILSDLMTTRHNDAISECASEVGLDISAEQSMIDMLHVLTTNNHVVLLNCGRILDENGLKKRSGYLALPASFSNKQLDQIEKLKLLLEEYHAITVWKIENNNLKTRSMGNNQFAISIIQDMISHIDKDIENRQR